MLTVNSLSGGRTSSYLAMNYPADIDIFALVCIDCHNASGKLLHDPLLVQMVNDKLEPYIDQYGEFRATAEDPATIKLIFDLEQKMGRAIKWVRGNSFETVMDKRNAIPNQAMRFCTYEMKIKPIFEYLYLFHELPVEMRIGYRYDEKERANHFTEAIKTSLYCETKKSGNRFHRWEDVKWRTGSFPMIEDKVNHYTVQKYWEPSDLVFPKDSNCQNCFWKQIQQLRKNFDTNPSIMQWAAIQEIIRDRTFKKEMPYQTVKKVGLQTDFFFGTGSGCQAGFCTD